MRKAFTLIELLIVIFIIAMLIALVMPAIQWAREAARRVQCTNHQKNLAIGLHSYENTKGSLPGWRDFITVTPPPLPTPPGWRDSDEVAAQASWVFSILPYIEQVDLFERLKTGQVVSGTPIPSVALLHCPSHLEGPASRAMNYIVNGGAVDDFHPSDDWVTTDGNVANGLFLDRVKIVAGEIPGECWWCRDNNRQCRYNQNAGKYRNAVARLSDISKMDGTAYTLLTSENAQRGFWIAEQIVHFGNNRRGRAPQLAGTDWRRVSSSDRRWTVDLNCNFMDRPPTLPPLPPGEAIITENAIIGHTLEGSVAFCWSRNYHDDTDRRLCQIAYTMDGFLTSFRTTNAKMSRNTKRGFLTVNDANPDDGTYLNPVPSREGVDGLERFPVWMNMFVRERFDSEHSWYLSARPSSHHGPVVIVSFADGNVRRLNQDMEEVVFVQLMTAGDAQSDAGWGNTDNLLFRQLLNTGTVFQ